MYYPGLPPELHGLLGGQQQPQQQPGFGQRLTGLLGDPRMMMGLNLLSAARDGRIDPYQAAARGVMTAQQFKDSRSEQERRDEELALRKQLIDAQIAGIQNKPAPTRKLSLPNNQIQDQSLVGGEWTNVGDPYYRRDPYGHLKPVTSFDPETGSFLQGFADMSNVDETGRPRMIIGGEKPAETKPTESNRAASGYLARMQGAEGIISNLESIGYSPSTASETARGVSNVTMSPQGQMYDQAKRDWVRAKLRKESGAVIGEEEMISEIATYFPQFGDSQEVIDQKARARRLAEEQMKSSAGMLGKDVETTPMPTKQDSEGWEIIGRNPG